MKLTRCGAGVAEDVGVDLLQGNSERGVNQIYNSKRIPKKEANLEIVLKMR